MKRLFFAHQKPYLVILVNFLSSGLYFIYSNTCWCSSLY